MSNDPFSHLIKQAQHNHELEEMNHDALNAEFSNFIDSLTIDQLKTLRTMVAVCTTEGNATTFYGLVTGAIMFKHGRDWHGNDPEALLKMGAAQAEAEPVSVQEGQAVEPVLENLLETPPYLAHRTIFECNTPGFYESDDVLHMSDDDIKSLRNKYGLVVRNGRLSCENCHRTYVTLTDRMLRVPGIDGCVGCQAQAGQG